MACIKKIAYYLPGRVLTNEDLVKEFPEWSVEKIAGKIGVNSRRIASEDETAGDLAYKAAEKLFEENPDISREEIDLLILCTQSPDYFLPTTACLLQEKLKLPTTCGAMDFNLGCSGYVYGLALAKGLIAGGIAGNVLLLTAETYSKYLHPRDKGNRTIFGDAATATLISTEGWAEIEEFSLGTDGAGAENLIVKTGGVRYRERKEDLHEDEHGNPVSSDYLFMNGAKILSFTQKTIPPLVKDVIAKNGLEEKNVALFIFHQANQYILDFLRKKMKIAEERFYIDMSEKGNTVSNSVAIALADAFKEGRIHSGDNVLLCGFGVGYSWGACILRMV